MWQAKVQGIEPETILRDGGSVGGGTVTLATGEVVPYDYLIVSLGAEPDSKGVPGVKDFAKPFATLDDAVWLDEQLQQLEQRGAGQVVVVGGGYAGVELSAVIAEQLRQKDGGNAGVNVELVTPGQGILERCPEGQREAAMQVLTTLGVKVVTGTKVTELSSPVSPAEAVAASPGPMEATWNATDASSSSSSSRESGPGDDASTSSSGTVSSSSSSVRNGSSSIDTSTPGKCRVHMEPMLPSGASSGSSQVVDADVVIWTAGSKPASKFLQVRRYFESVTRCSVVCSGKLASKFMVKAFKADAGEVLATVAVLGMWWQGGGGARAKGGGSGIQRRRWDGEVGSGTWWGGLWEGCLAIYKVQVVARGNFAVGLSGQRGVQMQWTRVCNISLRGRLASVTAASLGVNIRQVGIPAYQPGGKLAAWW
jgi:hypothetical protein